LLEHAGWTSPQPPADAANPNAKEAKTAAVGVEQQK
jgi:hypothetical protein